MSIDPGYLAFPKRREGYDHDIYAWSALKDRPPVAWPGGKRVAIWIRVSHAARSESWNTHDLLREAGLTYMCDWVNDELPYRFANGLINLPLNHELSDRQIITVQQQSADSYAQQMRNAFDWLAVEAAGHGGRMLPLHITPYIIALPYRIAAFEALITDLGKPPAAWAAPGGAIVEAWAAQQ